MNNTPNGDDDDHVEIKSISILLTGLLTIGTTTTSNNDDQLTRQLPKHWSLFVKITISRSRVIQRNGETGGL